MKRSSNLLIGGLAVLAVIVGIVLAVLPPRNAPAVEFTTINGERFSTVDLRGKVVLVNFWATSCVICVKEMPALVATYEKFKVRGFETVAVAMRYDPPNYVLNFVQTRGLPFKVALDVSGEAARGFGDVRLTPTTFVIDKRGRIVKRYLGEPDFAELHALLEQKLAEAS
jgi:peroxiredoxin